MRKLLLTICLILILSPKTLALSTKTCPNDYYHFISEVKDERLRNEYIKDFTSKSYCQIEDILKIDDELDKVKDSFRDAAFVCQDTSAYKIQYSKLLLQQYFVRHIQEIPDSVIDQADLEAINAEKDLLLERLKHEMHEEFVVKKKIVSNSNFETYFAAWTSLYYNRIDDYSNCSSGAWAELKESAKQLSEAWQNLMTVDDGEEEKKEEEDEEAPIFRTNIIKDLKAFFDKSKEDEEQKVEPEKTVSEAAKESGTILGTFGILENEQSRLATELPSADRMGRYLILYGQGGANVAYSLTSQIQDLNETLLTSNIKEFPELINKLDGIYEKQCK